jgi:hypothetical protein
MRCLYPSSIAECIERSPCFAGDVGDYFFIPRIIFVILAPKFNQNVSMPLFLELLPRTSLSLFFVHVVAPYVKNFKTKLTPWWGQFGCDYTDVTNYPLLRVV